MKKKNIMMSGVCLAICAMSVMGTYALLTAQTKDPVVNSFTGMNEKDFSIDLIEENFEKDKAQSYIPGDVIRKDPTIINTSTSKSAYVAIKVSYQLVEGATTSNISISDFAKYATINGISEDWELLASNETEGTQLYMYKNEIAAKATVSPALFQSVTVNPDLKFDENGLLPFFNIKVEGYATPYLPDSYETAKAALIDHSEINE